MDSRLSHLRATSRSDDFRRDAAVHQQARALRSERESGRFRRPHPIAFVATTLHLHRGMLRFGRS
jgi:hypothetical protein